VFLLIQTEKKNKVAKNQGKEARIDVATAMWQRIRATEERKKRKWRENEEEENNSQKYGCEPKWST
jgi:hypothetical protein